VSPGDGGPGPGPGDGDAGGDGAGGDGTVSGDGGRPDGGPPDQGGGLDAPDPDGSWRSALVPRGWRPVHAGGAPDDDGRYLPDFSYGGYRRGDVRPPYGQGQATITVDAALGDGQADATAAIQQALDAVCDQGGGVVQLPGGTFLLRLPDASAPAALLMRCSQLVLRGAGSDRTRLLFDDARRVRNRAVIAMTSSGSFLGNDATTSYPLTEDAPLPTTRLTVASTAGLAAGDLVVVRNDVTDAFRAEHRMDQATAGEAGLWPTAQFAGLFYPRQLVALDATHVELDGPTHYELLQRDAARLYKITGFNAEMGIESLALGMVENKQTPERTEPDSDDDYTVTGTFGYEVHNSRAIDLNRVHDVWVYDVKSFQPDGNASGAHVLSTGILVQPSAFRVTVEKVELGRAQYRGGGGNGYLFHVQGNDALFVDSVATQARHGFIMNQSTSGNVFRRVTIVESRLTDDAHRFLSHANLYDLVTLDSGCISAVNRGTTSGGGGFTATQHVIWNVKVQRNHPTADGCAVESAQWGHGYLIGSSAVEGQQAKLCPMSFTNGYWASLDQGDPADLVEGEAMGATLFPSSLYEAQRALRCQREQLTCP
jgi:hypothetical protein